jgi:hypothetical protein
MLTRYVVSDYPEALLQSGHVALAKPVSITLTTMLGHY